MSLAASVVIATRGRPDAVQEALPLVAAAAAHAGDTEVIVVEQAGVNSAPLARTLGIRHIAHRGRGVSLARNAGIEAANGAVVLCTDDDCLVPVTWVADHLAALADADVAGSFGRVTGLPRHEAEGADPAERVRRHGIEARPWDVGHASNMAVRRAPLLAVGGFDERIGPGSRGVQAGEDADLIARLLSAGYVLVSGTGAPVRHREWRTTAETEAVLRAYEEGAGVWIGAALRARRPHAAQHLRARWWMLRPRCTQLIEEHQRWAAARLAGALVIGLGRGLALSPRRASRIQALG